MPQPTIETERIYDEDGSHDLPRILVDRLWPRGISKKVAALDDWMREVAPSDDLRTRFHEGELNWPNFKAAYKAQLKDGKSASQAEELLDIIRNHGGVRLLYASKNEERNNAVALKEWLVENL
jgi:uncharacterized protein YeaO (DUF488 family)